MLFGPILYFAYDNPSFLSGYSCIIYFLLLTLNLNV